MPCELAIELLQRIIGIVYIQAREHTHWLIFFYGRDFFIMEVIKGLPWENWENSILRSCEDHWHWGENNQEVNHEEVKSNRMEMISFSPCLFFPSLHSPPPNLSLPPSTNKKGRESWETQTQKHGCGVTQRQYDVVGKAMGQDWESLVSFSFLIFIYCLFLAALGLSCGMWNLFFFF